MIGSNAMEAAARWLTDFAEALRRADRPAVLALFGEESYWRDLVAFTWTIATMEHRAEIGAMLEATLARVRPERFVLEGTPREENGVVQAWFTFETAVGRGKGHLRLKAGKAWTLLTTLQELKGFEEKQGATREQGTQHGAVPIGQRRLLRALRR